MVRAGSARSTSVTAAKRSGKTSAPRQPFRLASRSTLPYTGRAFGTAQCSWLPLEGKLREAVMRCCFFSGCRGRQPLLSAYGGLPGSSAPTFGLRWAAEVVSPYFRLTARCRGRQPLLSACGALPKSSAPAPLPPMRSAKQKTALRGENRPEQRRIAALILP